MRPRMRKGVISAIYMGEVSDAAPIPNPPRTRKKMNVLSDRGMAVPMAEAKKASAARIRTFLRPNRSLRKPASPAPTAQPTDAQPAAEPSAKELSSKCSCK